MGTAVTRPPRQSFFGQPLVLYSGFGWNLGYIGFDPYGYYGYGYGYGYGSSAWLWGRNGFWYDPYGPGYYSGSGSERETRVRSEMGSIRLKASPNLAKVYVDGTLMGTVDDFDGMTHHLQLELGAHRIELRADGYQTMATDVTVGTGTTTLRLSLKKK